MGTESSVNVGQSIKALREERRISLRMLSERSGVSANALSLIERGKTSPTVTTLVAIARAFNISVNDFFSHKDRAKEDFVVYRATGNGHGNVIEPLTMDLKGQNLNPLLLRLAHNEKFRKDLCFHPGDEFVYCLTGEVECEVGKAKIKLGPGDAITYKAEIPHRTKAISPEGSSILVVFEIARL
jgi:transcriptional regulator with XRE-family HTH domain